MANGRVRSPRSRPRARIRSVLHRGGWLRYRGIILCEMFDFIVVVVVGFEVGFSDGETERKGIGI